MLRTALLLSCCSFFTTAVLAEETFDAATVATWVRQLESQERSQREEAERQLTTAGPQVLEHLPPITDRTNAELKQRLLRIRDALTEAQAAELTKASLVTLQGDMTFREAVESIQKQTGNVIVDFRERFNQPADNRSLALDIDNQPFWSAFDQLAEQAGVNIYPYVGELRKLAVVAGGDVDVVRTGRADYVGLFRIEPTALACQRNFRDPRGDMLRLTLELVWEPRILPIMIRQDFADLRVETDTGQPVTVQQSGMRQIPVQTGVAALDVQVPLSLPGREVKEITKLSGKFLAMVPAGNVTFEFDDLVDGKGATQTRGGLSVVLDDIRLNQGLQQISLRIRFDSAAESLQSHLDWVENNVVRLLDPDGKPSDEPGYERYFERDSEIGFRYIFPVEEENLAGWKLVYTSPAGVSEVEIPFQVTKIPLP